MRLILSGLHPTMTMTITRSQGAPVFISVPPVDNTFAYRLKFHLHSLVFAKYRIPHHTSFVYDDFIPSDGECQQRLFISCHVPKEELPELGATKVNDAETWRFHGA
jgi:hypothetical protein